MHNHYYQIPHCRVSQTRSLDCQEWLPIEDNFTENRSVFSSATIRSVVGVDQTISSTVENPFRFPCSTVASFVVVVVDCVFVLSSLGSCVVVLVLSRRLWGSVNPRICWVKDEIYAHVIQCNPLNRLQNTQAMPAPTIGIKDFVMDRFKTLIIVFEMILKPYDLELQGV
ncbi:hypothetical protein V6N13_138185 [Hibiscus sabdariffa]